MDTNTTIRVRPGCVVRLKRLSNGNVTEYKIIHAVRDRTELGRGSLSYTIENGILSDESPLGNALIGRRIGDIVRNYEILDISRTEEVIENYSDSMEEILLEKRDRLLKLEQKLKSGQEVDAIILSCRRYFYPQKSNVTIDEDFFNTESGESILKSVSTTNIAMEDTGYYRVDMELFDSDAEEYCSISAEMLINDDVLEKTGIHCGVRDHGAYSYDQDNESVVQLHSALVRIDPDTGSFVYRNNPFGIPYFFCLEKD